MLLISQPARVLANDNLRPCGKFSRNDSFWDSALRAGIFKAWGLSIRWRLGGARTSSHAPVHRLDEPTGISLGMVASPRCPLPFRPAKLLQLRNELPFLNVRLARDSAGTQTGPTRIVSCDRLWVLKKSL